MAPAQLRRPKAAIVGGGISGLAAAWQLAQRLPDAEITVFEASATVGGKLRICELAGTPVDVGAEALLARRPEGVDLIRAIGLGDQLIQPLSISAQVRAGGTSWALPARTMLGIPGDVDALRASGVLGAQTLAAVAAEPGREPLAPLGEDVSVGSLVRQRLGDEVVDRLVEPLLGGVYAGRADQLSLAATMPALWGRLHRDGGSLVETAAEVTGGGAAPTAGGPIFVSLAGGLARLATELGRSPLFAVQTGVTIRSIRRSASGFVLGCGPTATHAPSEVETDVVILATPAAKTSTLLGLVAPFAAAQLTGIETASMAIVSLAYERVALPPGSGLLVGTQEGFAVKAITLSSQKWPGTPAGLSLLRASVGRAGENRDLQLEDAELVSLVQRELGELIGVQSAPIDSLVTRWGGGLPQYGVGHVERVRTIRESVATVPGLAVCGASYDGLGIPACIAAASLAVDQVVRALAGPR